MSYQELYALTDEQLVDLLEMACFINDKELVRKVTLVIAHPKK